MVAVGRMGGYGEETSGYGEETIGCGEETSRYSTETGVFSESLPPSPQKITNPP
ncbi:hypothetical protein [Sporosarcina sp. SAFN-010]|uniref:hypothetical protein n=1 Tax=Sporosarcina sp. SAFN-010 TaxID=3387273 RepID=UPI003F7E41E3